MAMFAIDANAQSPADAVIPGALRSYSTMHSIGLEWDVTDDSDHDAAAAVEFRVRGAAAWRSTLPLVRIDYNGANRLAGSVLFLDPDTEYEVRVSLSDPDGGAETRVVVVRTRRIPVAPNGRVYHVVPGSGGGDGSIAAPFRGVVAAQAVAQAGDTFLLHAGGYGGRIRFDRPGTSAGYVAWKAAGDGEVLMDGIDVAASHLWLEGITIRTRAEALVSVNSPTNVVITRCNFLDNQYAIYLKGAGTNWYIADNTIVGDSPPESESFEGEGVELNTTSGHTIAHNTITNVADAISFPHTNVDIFGNDIFDTSDDGIEADNGQSNVRMWGNRIHNAVHNGISFQPQSGGPWYIIRNQVVGNEEAAFKFRTTDRFVLLHNTIVNWGTAWPGTSMMCCNEGHLLRAYARNNLWVSVQGGQIWGFDDVLRDWRTDLDYDGFDWGSSSEPFAYAGVTHPDLSSFSTASGLETHGQRVVRSTCFEDFQVPGPAPMSIPPHLMTLRAECEAVDRGEVLAGINDGYAGAAPDLGAHERGGARATYGPRATRTAVPAAPGFLRAEPLGTSISLQWTDNSDNEAGFRIERSSNGTTFTGLAVVGPATVAYSDATVSSGATYYYRVAAYNEAGLSSYSNTASAVVAPSTGAREIVLYARYASIGGGWTVTADSTAAGGARLQNPNAGAARIAAPLAAPTQYFEMTFNAEAGVGYRLWIRGKATSNSWANDSAYVQFDGSVTQSGAPVYRIDTTSGTTYQVEDCTNCGLSGWGWQDNGFGAGVLGPLVYFARTGQQRLRIQVREDGLGIDQIVLSAERYITARPGATKNDTTIVPQTGSPPSVKEVVLHARYASIGGGWTVTTDTTAASGARLQNANAGAARVAAPLASPTQYFDMTFTAEAGVGYRLWMRGRATQNSWANDSVYVQFDGSVDQAGAPSYRIGTTSATTWQLEDCVNCGLSGWGWQDNGFGAGVLGPLVNFSRTGPQRIRVQVREDGVGIDQIVLSAETYRQTSPGATKNDTVILGRTQ